ncbi:hypothetical protein HBI56_202280 [Parastagonospora nodorum]|uniref:Uncharacterized protein n=1 Tax=Phaeosphaeria nodorum (strain SN15 / ATCC MYA-4574 / FGSC 10173) TaxID=321614 RepID=A0A7U2EVW0_PHANO|nr:hypothetical protein HBH56_216810 [Parastagonospora nodorum]QRC93969.1 hypothetical protein JI435_404860 [Parastagonospora nodorum SN15]KAH3922624.1 hypothetical protein HBH54_220720 [Parastagonospora nodorum]KAH3942117.1 hypothetical protein HBH53_190640 [Parastagonospora nodorum]KAH3961343.1 hypothetical protein HBH51_185480 [Parastagonospora nodorum]
MARYNDGRQTLWQRRNGRIAAKCVIFTNLMETVYRGPQIAPLTHVEHVYLSLPSDGVM